MKLSLAHLCPPAKITAQLPDIQVMICRKIPTERTAPRHIVLIVFHPFALPVKVAALLGKGPIPIFIQIEHRFDLFRDIHTARHAAKSGNDRLNDHGFSWRIVQHDGTALHSVSAQRTLKKPEDDVRISMIIKSNADPPWPPHMKRQREKGQRQLSEHLAPRI